MGLFGKSIKEKLLDVIFLAIDENEPTKDKFLIFYRICQFDLSYDFRNDDEIETLNKYKREPIYPEAYKNLKSHIKAIYIVMAEISLFIAKRDKLISPSDYSYIFKNLDDELEINDQNAKILIDHYKEMSDNSAPILPQKLSKDVFEDKLESALHTLKDLAYISRDAFRMQIEQILGTQLHWGYRYTGEEN